ncbi:MAG: MarR family transcriptional regulator [Solobacterium sp.]|nr:MarR family transcriptional regulator [Solobacterium sp.]
MDNGKRIADEVRETKNAIQRYIGAEIARMGYGDVSFAQGGIIRFLYVNRDRDVYQRDLESFFDVRRSTLTGILQGLEKNGYLERVSVESDARLKKLVLTEKALQLEAKICENTDHNESVFLNGFREEEKEFLFAALERIRMNIRKETEERPQKDAEIRKGE